MEPYWMECWVDGYNLERKNHPNLFLFNLAQWFKRKICKRRLDATCCMLSI